METLVPKQYQKNVALRKESVDRNGRDASKSRQTLWSLSARRAWIEMYIEKVPADVYYVALRKESVDRNCYLDNIEITQAKSLSARRAWIEISLCFLWC